MEAEDWAGLSETSDCEGGCVEDSNEDENFCAFGDVPKLQFRKDVSKARWIDDLGMAEVVERKGQMWTTTGIVRNGKIYCSIEEILFLAEIGALNILDNDDTPLPLKDIYSKVLEKKNGCSSESFEAYKHLKALGYVVGRHCIPWTMESAKVNSSCQGALELHEKVDEGSTGGSVIPKMFSCIEINEMRPVFDV
ncbi:hypothetical protein ACH5RR_007258 [Cinchona calisaya]|uniref:tRNA-splicing endonuclease subunit Sen54 N-terminal domain-containing protein n=1 Tax=Cinchona calisaya TaxID=153742 RepID=A0ABD3AR84_9GENT